MHGQFSFWTRSTSIQPKAGVQPGQADAVNGNCRIKIRERELTLLQLSAQNSKKLKWTTLKMPKGFAPSVFVSSTCYDLNQVRADLKRFLDDLGLDPVLSEAPAFPVNPQSSPVENCLRAVKERADIFVLIIGARYGSQNESGKSITNLEYLEAKAKGLPVYVFVLKQILNNLPVWRENKQANYSSVVDTPKLFEFVEQLHESKDHWIFPFEEVFHIMQTLRSQFAYLFMDGLVLREKVKSLKLSPALTNLSGKSLKLLFERPLAWEYQFFTSVLIDEMNLDQEFKWDLKYEIQINKIKRFDDKVQICNWVQQKLGDIQGLVTSATKLMNGAIQEALGEPRFPGNPEHLVYVARRIAQIRKELLKWTIEFNRTDVNEFGCERLLLLISAFSKDAIEKLEGFPALMDSEIAKAIEANNRGEKYEAKVMLKIDGKINQEELAAEFERLINFS